MKSDTPEVLVLKPRLEKWSNSIRVNSYVWSLPGHCSTMWCRKILTVDPINVVNQLSQQGHSKSLVKFLLTRRNFIEKGEILFRFYCSGGGRWGLTHTREELDVSPWPGQMGVLIKRLSTHTKTVTNTSANNKRSWCFTSFESGGPSKDNNKLHDKNFLLFSIVVNLAWKQGLKQINTPFNRFFTQLLQH